MSLFEREEPVMPCPDCPDGNEWNSRGPTGRACKTCGGYAVVYMDGSKIDTARPQRNKGE